MANREQEDREPLLSTTIDVPLDSPPPQTSKKKPHLQPNDILSNNRINQPSSSPSVTFANNIKTTNSLTNSSHNSPLSQYRTSSSSLTDVISSQGIRTAVHVPSTSHHEGNNFVRMIERNVEYIRGHFEEFFASRTSSSSRSSLFVPVISFIILFLYIINTIAWHMNESASLQHDKETLSKEEAIVSEEDPDPAFDKHLPVLVKTLTISPGSLLIPYNWLWTGLSVMTYYFIELYFYQVVMDIVVLTLSTTLIDPLWGRIELYRFFLVVNVSVGILSTAHYIIIYAIKGDAVYLYGVTVYGLTGYLAAVCVTIKQLLPDSVVVTTSLGKFKNNHVPLSALILCWVLYLLNLTSGVSVITFFYGLITSWIYLRFLQVHPSNGSQGDLSEGFSFPTFFPNVLQPLVALISTGIYTFFVKIKVISDYAASSTRNLSERLTDNFKIPSSSRRNQHKYHPSGDYDYLNNPPPESTVVLGATHSLSSTKATSRQVPQTVLPSSSNKNPVSISNANYPSSSHVDAPLFAVNNSPSIDSVGTSVEGQPETSVTASPSTNIDLLM